MSLETPVSSHQEVISYFCNDMGQPLPAWLGNRLFDMRSSIPTYMHHEPPEELEEQADALYWDFLGRCDRKNLAELERGEDRLNDDIHAKEGMALGGVSQIDDYISSLRREKRHPDCALSRKSQIDDRIAEVEKYKPQLLAALPDEINTLRRDYETLEQDIFESLTFHGRIEPLYTVRWTMCSRYQPPPVNVSLWTEERFMGNLNVGSKWKAQFQSIRENSVQHTVSRNENPAKTPQKSEGAKPVRNTIKASAAQAIALKLGASPSLNPKQGALAKSKKLERADRKRRNREARLQLSAVLQKHGTLKDLKYVRAFLKGKTGADLKMALIHLAKHDFMSTDDAVYLFKVLSALKTNKSK